MARVCAFGDIVEIEKCNPGPLEGVDRSVVLRIRKILDLGLHPDTPQAEAEHSMRLAKIELDKYNLEQAKVMLATGGIFKEALGGSAWSLSIKTSKDKRVPMSEWIIKLCHACCNGFHVQFYWLHYPTSTEITFYGISNAAQVAAETFFHYFNRVESLQRAYTPDFMIAYRELQCEYARLSALPYDARQIDELYIAFRRKKLRTFARHARESYLYGLCIGIQNAFIDENEREHRRLEELEVKIEADRQRKLALREAIERWKTHEAAQTMDQMSQGVPPGEIIVHVDESFDVNAARKEVAACKALVVHVEQLATQVLKDRNITVTESRGHHPGFSVHDDDAFIEGERHGKRMRKEDAQVGLPHSLPA